MASTTKKIAEGTAIFFTRKIWISLFSGVATLFIIRSLGIYHYGVLTLALSIVGILAPFLDFDIGTVVSVDMANQIGNNRLDKVKKLIKDYAKLELVVGFLFFLSLFLVNGIISQRYGVEISNLVKIISFLLFLYAVKNIFSNVFYGFSNFRYFTLIDTTEALIKFILVILLYYFGQFSVVKVALIILISSSISTLITLPFFIKILKPLKGVKAHPNNLLKEILFKHGKFHIITQPLKSSLESLRLWIIKIFVGVEAVAIFQVANKLFGYLTIFFSSFEGVLLPLLAHEVTNNIELARQMVKKSVKYFTYLGVVTMVLSYVFIDDVLHFFFLDKYDASLPVLYWSLLTFSIIGFSMIIRPLFFAFKAQKLLMKTFFYVNIISLPLGAYLTYEFGVIGFAVPIGAFLTVIVRYYDIRKLDRKFYIKFREFFNFDNYDKIFFSKILRRLKIKSNN